MVVLLLVGMTGCGVKGPPVSPDYSELPVVRDLAYQASQNQIELTWTIPTGADANTAAIVRASIYRLKQALGNISCPECPQTFAVIARLPARSGIMKFTDTIEKGFQYYYKIVLSDTGKKHGGDSNIVHYRYELKSVQ
jgi:predicted small lipoprotein YifL